MRTRRRLRIAAAIAGVGVVVGGAGAAGAEPAWQPPQLVDTVRGVPAPDVGINSGGNSTVVYTSAAAGYDDPRPWLVRRPPGGGFIREQAGPGGMRAARMSTAPDGATAIAAVDRGRIHVTVYPAPGPAGLAGRGPTEGTTTRIDVAGQHVDGLDVEIDGSGVATVVWASPRIGALGPGEEPTQVYTATVGPGGPAAVAAEPLGAPGRCGANIDVNLRGDAVVTRACVGQPDDLFYRPAGGPFGPAEAPFGAGDPNPGDGVVAASIDGAGTVHATQAVAVGQLRGPSYSYVRYAVRPRGAPFGPAERLDFAEPADFQLGAQEDGDVVAAWAGGYAVKSAGGDFVPGRPVPSKVHAGLRLAVSPNGPALMAWRERVAGAGGREQVVAVKIGPAGASPVASLGTPAVLDGARFAPLAFAINDSGQAVGAWEQRCRPDAASTVVAVALDDWSAKGAAPCPSRTAPRLSVSPRRAQLAGRTLRVRLACSRSCRGTLRGRVAQRRGGRTVARTRARRVRLSGEAHRVVRLRLAPRQARRVRRALAAGRRLDARLTFKSSDTGAGPALRRIAVPIRRGAARSTRAARQLATDPPSRRYTRRR